MDAVGLADDVGGEGRERPLAKPAINQRANRRSPEQAHLVEGMARPALSGTHERFHRMGDPAKEKFPNLFSPTPTVAFGDLCAEFLKEGEPIPCVSILTRAANAVVSSIHDRMPVMLEEAQWDAWLAPNTAAAGWSAAAAFSKNCFCQ
jgi:hypothetical protein